MLYKKNAEEKLSEELFKNPTSEYRSTPFWAWNTNLKMEELLRQIEIFKKMGFGGFHMHVRTGMSTSYLTDKFMSFISGCTEKAKEENMLSWLYDEDRWPSGSAGGIITKDKKYRCRRLIIKSNYFEDNEYNTLIACYDIVLDKDGRMTKYAKIDKDAVAEGKKWYAYLNIEGNSAWYNNQSYVDTLSKEAMDKFIALTHERYKEKVGDEFDKTIPAIFTDEPQFGRKLNKECSTDDKDSTIPWTDDLPDTFKAKYSYDIMAKLPEIFWELPEGEISETRYFYHDHVCDRFTEAFADNIGGWCEKNGIALTGHMMEEPTLRSQTRALGEAMRSYRSFGIPGIDMLCAIFEFTTAKQTQSAVHQFGKEAMLSELYGVTGWDYDFRGYKLHGDWQACLGVTVRVPHLSWVAMGGEAKRDYPASISYQSPWWTEYSYLEDHFARVNTLMTRGKPCVKVGVIHPVESYWIHFGPDDLTKELREDKDRKFKNLTDWLIKGSVDFDFISESLLPQQNKEGNVPFTVGEMNYDVIVVPECESLRSTTLDRLEQFKAKGGKLVFMGEAPSVSDGKKCARGLELYNKSINVAYTREAILDTLEENRYLSIKDENGQLTKGFIYQLRQDNDGLNLFISRACEPNDKHVVIANNLVITIKGEYAPVEYNTITGDIYEIPCEYKDGNTIITKTLYDYDSLLLKLKDGKQASEIKEANTYEFTNAVFIPDEVDYELSEDNVLLIDMCEYAIDNGEFCDKEEILRLDNICREKMGWNERGGAIAQPWSVPKEFIEHTITLRYTFESEIEVVGAKFAIENPEEAKITFNGVKLSTEPTGWFTDKDVKTIAMPVIEKGKNTIIVTIPFGKTTNTEWMYILGNFGVKLVNNISVLISKPEKITFGSITEQGFPFYGANVTYKFEAETTEKAQVKIGHYMGALTSVSVDGEEKGKIVFPPYTLCIDNLTAGKHNFELKLYGNRNNCFGPVHRTIQNGWIGPDAWRTKDKNWSYDYQLRNIGIMDKPEIKD